MGARTSSPLLSKTQRDALRSRRLARARSREKWTHELLRPFLLITTTSVCRDATQSRRAAQRGAQSVSMSQARFKSPSSLSVAHTSYTLRPLPLPRYLSLVPADAPYRYGRKNELARAVVREAAFELIEAQRRSATTSSAATTSSTATTSVASTSAASTSSAATTSSTTTAASSTQTQEAFSPPPRRSTRSKSAGTSSNARPAIRQTRSDPAQPDSRIPLQIVNDGPRGAAEKHRNKDLQPTYHNVDSDQRDEATRTFKESLKSSTQFERLRVQVPPSYCLEHSLPQESLSLGAIQRTARNPPAVDLERFRRTTVTTRIGQAVRPCRFVRTPRILSGCLRRQAPRRRLQAASRSGPGIRLEGFLARARRGPLVPARRARLSLQRWLALHQGRNDVNQVRAGGRLPLGQQGDCLSAVVQGGHARAPARASQHAGHGGRVGERGVQA